MATSLPSRPRGLRLRSLRSLRLSPREPFGHHFLGHSFKEGFNDARDRFQRVLQSYRNPKD